MLIKIFFILLVLIGFVVLIVVLFGWFGLIL